MTRVLPMVALLALGCTNSVVVERGGGAGGSAAADDDDHLPIEYEPGPDDGCPRPTCYASDTSLGWDYAFYALSDPALGNCSSIGCHGDEQMASNGVFLPIEDQARFYQGLTQPVNAKGDRYVDPGRPMDSWIHCHLAIPHAHFPTEHIPTIEKWLCEGAPGP